MTGGTPLGLLAIAVAAIVAFAPAPLGVAAAVGGVLLAGVAFRRFSASGPLSASSNAPPSSPTDPWAGWIETMPCAVLLLDEALMVVGANEAALTLCRRPRADIEGASLIRAIRDHNIMQIARESAAVPREVDIRDGRVARVTASRLGELSGGARYVLAVEDLTELRRAQRARSDLVANASHELRTPVTAALALAETLEGGIDDEARRRDFQQRLTNEVGRLSSIIEGLLKLSRLESQSDDFTLEPLEPGDLLETAAHRIEPLLAPGQSIEVADWSDGFVDGDRERVLEVLSNLLENALRVSPLDGTVTLAAFRGEGEIRFEVRDEGPGIIPRDRARVFERFYTGDESRTAANSSGLGLAIARHIVSRLGGRIWVGDQTPGATLCFTLPMAPNPAHHRKLADERGMGPSAGEPAA